VESVNQSISERLRHKAGRARSVLRERRGAPRDELQDGRALRQQVSRLRKRVVDLEQEVQELRRLSPRLAELADLVQELLVPAAKRDDERLKELLDDYDPGR
jgi:phosphoserine phosphatase